MRVLDHVMLGLGVRRIAGWAPALTQSLEILNPAGQQLVLICLMPRVEDEAAPRGVEDPMQREGEFHHPEIRPQMPTRRAHPLDQERPTRGQAGQPPTGRARRSPGQASCASNDRPAWGAWAFGMTEPSCSPAGITPRMGTSPHRPSGSPSQCGQSPRLTQGAPHLRVDAYTTRTVRQGSTQTHTHAHTPPTPQHTPAETPLRT